MRWRWLAAATLGLLVLGAIATPRALIAEGDRRRDHADSLATLPQRVEGWAQARQWYRRADLFPMQHRFVSQAEAHLDERLAADFETHRQTLSAGVAGAQLHLDWLADEVERPMWGGERARQQQLRALVTYSRFDEAHALAEAARGPFARSWRGIAALSQGQLEAVPDALRAQMLGLGLRRQGPPRPEEAQGSDLAILATAEHLRRRGDSLEARRLLAPLVESDGPLASAAATSWGMSLIDELLAEPAGTMLVGAGGQVEPVALAGLRARLVLAPEDDPTWATAWLVLAELEDRRGRKAQALDATWAAVQTAAPAWAPTWDQLHAQARLDAPLALHPDRVQRSKVVATQARLDAAAAGQPVSDLATLEAALLLLQARSLIAARQLDAARARLAKADELSPDSPAIVGWRILAAVLADDPEAARQHLDGLPQLPDTHDDDELRQQAAAWVDPAPVSTVDQPARAMRTRLRQPWAPGEPLAFAAAHAQQLADLDLALATPPEDAARLPQVLAQAHLRWRIHRSLQGSQPALDDAAGTRDALGAVAMAEPLWALFALGAYDLEGAALPEAVPAGDNPTEATAP